MSASVLIERSTSAGDEDLRATAVSDVPVEQRTDDLPAVGSVLDERYEITGLLGQGGMGHVLSARHVVLGQRLAIKVLRREMTRDEEIVERFRREARAASAIGHVGIVAVKDFGTLASGASYYVMEHVEGVSLADLVRDEGPFTIARAVDVVRQIADALGAAHAAGIVHRDVKPENVLLTTFHGRPDHVKVLDFGIAKLDFASRLSGAHRVLGTPAYMSPEQCRGQTLDQRADVYALGILFFELLVGDVPFDDKRPLEVLRHQIETPAPPIRVFRDDVPEAIASTIASCLEKSPDARPASMKALVERLGPAPSRPIAFAGASSSPTPVPAASAAIGFAATSLSLTPVPRVATRPTPVRADAQPARATPVAIRAAPAGRAALLVIAGVALTALGVAALAAAGGILMRERVDESTTVAAETVQPPAPAAPAAVPGAPPPLAPASVGPTSVPVTPLAAPIAPAPAHPLHPHPAHVAPASAVAPTPPPAPAPTTAAAPEHPTIRVIDPWDDP